MAVTDDTREVLAATSESRHGIVTCVTIQVNISLYSFFFSFLFFSIFILWSPSREFAWANNNQTCFHLLLRRLDPRNNSRRHLGSRRPVYDAPNC
jgi:hypothetical protein